MSLENLLGDPSVHLLGECFEVNSDTSGLRDRFPQQVHLLPAADNALIGVAIGMALDGSKPIVHLAEAQSLWGIISQLGQEVNTGSDFPLPMVIRVPLTPGDDIPWRVLESLSVRVLCPRNNNQLQSAMATALQVGQPTVIIEPLLSLQQRGGSVDFNSTEILREGRHISLFAWGDAVDAALTAAHDLEDDGIDVEVMALNQLMPLCGSEIAESVSRTGRSVLVGPPSQLLQVIVDGAFWSLEGRPVTCGESLQEIKDALVESLR